MEPAHIHTHASRVYTPIRAEMAMPVLQHAERYLHIPSSDPDPVKTTADAFDEPWKPAPVEKLSNAAFAQLTWWHAIVISYGGCPVPSARIMAVV